MESRAGETDERDRVHGALASPVRRRLLAALGSERHGRTAVELADLEGLHVTTVRFHLDHLLAAGLVTARPEPAARRGRPSLRYSAVPGAGQVDRQGDPRDGMIDALAQAAAGGGTPEENALAAGRRWAEASRLPASSVPATEAAAEVLAELGFDPTPLPGDHGTAAAGVRLDLRSCPFRAAARRAPQVVCQVHAGFLREVVMRAADGVGTAVELVPFATPTTCRVHLTRASGADRAPSSHTKEHP